MKRRPVYILFGACYDILGVFTHKRDAYTHAWSLCKCSDDREYVENGRVYVDHENACPLVGGFWVDKTVFRYRK